MLALQLWLRMCAWFGATATLSMSPGAMCTRAATRSPASLTSCGSRPSWRRLLCVLTHLFTLPKVTSLADICAVAALLRGWPWLRSKPHCPRVLFVQGPSSPGGSEGAAGLTHPGAWLPDAQVLHPSPKNFSLMLALNQVLLASGALLVGVASS